MDGQLTGMIFTLDQHPGMTTRPSECSIVLLSSLCLWGCVTELSGHGVPSNHSFDNQTEPAGLAADDHGGRQAKSSEAFKSKTRSQFTQCTIYMCRVVLFPKRLMSMPYLLSSLLRLAGSNSIRHQTLLQVVPVKMASECSWSSHAA